MGWQDSVINVDIIVTGAAQLSVIASETKTDSYTITTDDLGKNIRMNAVSDTTLTFPHIDMIRDGARLTITKVGIGKLTLQMVDSDKIFDSSAGGSMYNDTTETYATIELEYCDATATWNVQGASGTWITV